MKENFILFIKQKRKQVFFTSLLLLILALSSKGAVTYSRYVIQRTNTQVATPVNYCFTSNYLTTGGASYTIYSGSVSIEVSNTDGITTTNESISYSISGTASDGSKTISGGTATTDSYAILTNNISSVSTSDGGGITLKSGTFYMYGGSITRCACGDISESGGDAGALMLVGRQSLAYLYGGEITFCEAENGGAISIFSLSTCYMLGTNVYKNYTDGSSNYPSDAITIYATTSGTTSLYVFQGTISGNDGPDHNGYKSADIWITKGFNGNAVFHMFGGTIGKIGYYNSYGTANIYDGVVGEFVYVYSDTNIHYYGGKSFTVNVPNAVRADGSQTINIEISRLINGVSSVYKKTVSSGIGTASSENSALPIQLRTGTYTVKITSVSMIKIYTVTVSTSGAGANEALDNPPVITPVSRTMTLPVTASVDSTSITLQMSGTGNTTSDGVIYYGYADSDNSSEVTNWQTSNCFTDLSGTNYFFTKATAVNQSFTESISPNGLKITFMTITSVTVNGSSTAEAAAMYAYSAVVLGSSQPSQTVLWTISGNTSPDTSIDSSGILSVSANETADSLTVTATSVANTLIYGSKVVTIDENIENPAIASIGIILDGTLYTIINEFTEETDTTFTASASNILGGKKGSSGVVFDVVTEDSTAQVVISGNNYSNGALSVTSESHIVEFAVTKGNCSYTYTLTLTFKFNTSYTKNEKSLAKLSGNISNTVNVTANGAFTVLYEINYIPNSNVDPLVLTFSDALPLGTKLTEYSCAVKPQFREIGNRLTGTWEPPYASLLAHVFV